MSARWGRDSASRHTASARGNVRAVRSAARLRAPRRRHRDAGLGETREDATHVREGDLHPGQRIFGVGLVLQVHTPAIVDVPQLLEDCGDGHGTFADVARDYADWIDVKDEGYAVDREFPDLVYVPEDAFFSLPGLVDKSDTVLEEACAWLRSVFANAVHR